MSNWTYSQGGQNAQIYPWSRSFNPNSGGAWVNLTASAACDIGALDVLLIAAGTTRFQIGVGAGPTAITPLILGGHNMVTPLRVPVMIPKATSISIFLETGSSYLGCYLIGAHGALLNRYRSIKPLNAAAVTLVGGTWVQVSASTPVAAQALQIAANGTLAGGAISLGTGPNSSSVTTIGDFYSSYGGNDAVTPLLDLCLPAGSNLWAKPDSGGGNLQVLALN